MKKLFQHDWAVFALVVLMNALLGWMAWDIAQTGKHGFKTGGLIVLGPFAIAYGILGIARRDFPDFEPSKADERPFRFWCIGLGFTIGGILATVGGIALFAR